MRRAIPPILPAAVVLAAIFAAPARAQTPAKPAKAAQGPVPAPVIGCPSLANYRLLRREAPEEAAAAARLADPKADHLGCAAFPRERVAALVEQVALGAEAYECLALQGTAICHWTAAGSVSPPAAAKPRPKPSPADKARR